MRKWARVFLKGNNAEWIDYPLPGDDLANFVRSVRMQGFIGPDGPAQAYVPLDEIRLIIMVEAQANVVALRPMPPASA